jgi:hypothetical protein
MNNPPEHDSPRAISPPEVTVAEDTPEEYVPSVPTTPAKRSPVSKSSAESFYFINELPNTAGLFLAFLGLLTGAISMFLNMKGVGDPSTAVSNEKVLGVNLELDKLHKCGYDCWFVGNYEIHVDLFTKQTQYGAPITPKVMPWYLELTQGSKPGSYLGKLPKAEDLPDNPPKTLDNALELPDNLTPHSVRVVSRDSSEGTIKFSDGSVYNVRTPDELGEYEEGTHWVIRTEIMDKNYLKRPIRIYATGVVPGTRYMAEDFYMKYAEEVPPYYNPGR